ncbi:MAG TPA: citrate lyase holo-[acyl-carrier protein] synthase, partial [Clostridia bacterium]|nr:citrate lyase holo-[acyl-carrier protein] synthase [Clostridia bacterium]
MSALFSYAAIDCLPQSLEALLANREDRQARQDALREKTGLPLLSMTLNLPGPCKRTPPSAFFFDCQVQDLTRLLEGLGARILARDRVRQGTGDELILAVQGLEVEALKSLALTLEETSAASRLLDLDVLTDQGIPFGRAQLGLPARPCLLCDQPAFVCSRSQAHPHQAVRDKSQALLQGFVKNRLSGLLQSLALEASSFELMVAPKPGLVTPFDSGAHKDMDRFSFSRSQAALAPYYGRAFDLGWADLPMDDLAVRLRQAGLLAQAD